MPISLSLKQLFDCWRDPRLNGEKGLPVGKDFGTGIVLLALMYIRVAASLANSKRFVSSDLIAPSCRGARSTHSKSSWNEIQIVQLKLPHTGTGEVSRSSLTKRQRADTLKSAYWKTVARSHFDGQANGGAQETIGV